MNIANGFWLIVLLIVITLMILFNMQKIGEKKKKTTFIKRRIPAIKELEKQQGRAIESGQRIHVAVGNSDLLDENNAASLLAVEVMENLARNSAASDRPLITTTSDGAVSLLLQSRLHHQYCDLNLKDLYRPQLAQMSGSTPFAYTAGILPIIHDEHISINIAAGKLGSEVGLIAEAGNRQKAVLIGGSTEPEGQAVLYGMAQEPLIGEEIFAIPAYLKEDQKNNASLKVQDILRFSLIGFLLAGSLLKLLGVL
ncbi:MAG: hypothetical protein J7K85_07295 [Anaerolineaceae bacterium]|nr:hypothetical protein [Anaerolineaceae bacterium]